MNEHQIDTAILAAARPAWRKVAMVLIKACDAVGDSLPAGEQGLNIVAKRIEALVSKGYLVAQGNIQNWRHSEVRLSQNAVTDRPAMASD